ncbi:MAG TPA: hypothetical protein VGQ99_03090 [Tepidisphaeraceae bacterium]|jgi:hypothetical protein|nr:hypothetical protein [Tepidisphaeraceae bacterium]
MTGRVGLVLGFGASVILLIAALWGWQNADLIVVQWKMSGESAVWGVRCAAVGLAAAAQVVLLTVIGRWVYGRDLVSDILRLCGVLVFMLAGVTAVALALAGRQ